VIEFLKLPIVPLIVTVSAAAEMWPAYDVLCVRYTRPLRWSDDAAENPGSMFISECRAGRGQFRNAPSLIHSGANVVRPPGNPTLAKNARIGHPRLVLSAATQAAFLEVVWARASTCSLRAGSKSPAVERRISDPMSDRRASSFMKLSPIVIVTPSAVNVIMIGPLTIVSRQLPKAATA
jgi:hypothetical protein